MTIGEWVEHTEEIRNQYREGAITAIEYVHKVVANAMEIPEKDFAQSMIDDANFPSQEEFTKKWVTN